MKNRISSYFLIFTVIIIFFIYFYNNLMYGFLDYLPEYVDYTLLIVFFILISKFMVDVGYEIS